MNNYGIIIRYLFGLIPTVDSRILAVKSSQVSRGSLLPTSSIPVMPSSFRGTFNFTNVTLVELTKAE